jgi:hypothetical protein
MNDPTPRFVRQISHERKDGYEWNPVINIYEEGDTLFRARINADPIWRRPTHEGPTTAPNIEQKL